jgi:hypothetical protein
MWVRHPNIDDGERKVEIPRSALRHYRRSGWEETDPPPPPEPRRRPEKTSEAPAEAGASAVPDKSPRGRRATRGDE